MAEGHFINPSEFIDGFPKSVPFWADFRYLSRAVVDRPYWKVCEALGIFHSFHAIGPFFGRKMPFF